MNVAHVSKTWLLVPVFGATVLSGCTGTNAATDQVVIQDRSARVQLDYETSQIAFPIEQYQISDSDWAIVSQARELILNQCMVKKGFTPDPDHPASNFEDRNFGIWNVERARQYGFSIPGLETTTDNLSPKGPGWGDARDMCVQQEADGLAQVSPPDPTVNPNMADEIQHQSLALASKDPAWTNAREEWWTCLRSRGLEPRTGDQEWSSKQALDIAIRASEEAATPATRQEGIRVATLEAECNQETRLTQRLGDIQASYQLPLIQKNQAALNETRADGEKVVAKAKQFRSNNQ